MSRSPLTELPDEVFAAEISEVRLTPDLLRRAVAAAQAVLEEAGAAAVVDLLEARGLAAGEPNHGCCRSWVGSCRLECVPIEGGGCRFVRKCTYHCAEWRC